LQLETWDDKTTGAKRTKLKVGAEAMQFINDGKGASSQAPAASESAPADDDGEDIPF